MFCKTEVETPQHLFFPLQSSGYIVWKEILSWTSRYNNDVKNISLPDVLNSAKFSTNKDLMIINHTLLLAKFFIYRCKLDKKRTIN